MKNLRDRWGDKRARTTGILIRYWLLQLPALALLALILIYVQRWVALPSWVFWGALGAWAIKDAILYPFVWHAYDWNRPRDANPMLGTKGIAIDRLAPSGYVQVRGELWRAKVAGGSRPIEKGEQIEVKESRGLTLIVQLRDEAD